MDKEPDVTPATWPSLKSIPLDATSFTANGREYRVCRTVSFDRWETYEQLQIEIGLARTFSQVFDGLREAYDLCNQVATGKPVFADLAVLLRDLTIGVTLIGEKQAPTVLRMAALFINREGEDPRYISEDLIASKIEDWRTEGIEIGYFFRFALASIPGYLAAFRAVSPSTSEEAGADKDAASTSSTGSATSEPATTTSSPPSATGAPRTRKSGGGRTSSTSSRP